MTNDYIYIKLCSNNSISLRNIKVKLINKCNKIVFTGKTGCLGKIKIPVCNNEVYKLVIYSNLLIVTPLIAKRNKVYCINVDKNKRKKHLVTFMIMDKYNPNIKIEGGTIILCQDIQSK